MPTADGEEATVEKVEREGLNESVPVYNFNVMDYHTYYVGENGVLVHNKCNTPESPAGESGNTSSPYANLQDSKSVGEGKKFTSAQKKNIIQQNMERNGGVIKSDLSGETLVPATQSKKGITPNPLEAQIDHINPRSKGGSNSYSNSQVLSRAENIKKSNK